MLYKYTKKNNYLRLYTNTNHLQLLYMEVIDILLYQWLPRPILPEKHQECSEGCILDKIYQGYPWLIEIKLKFKKK